MNTRLSFTLSPASCAAGMKWMSSHGYSTFFAFGSGTAAGLTTRTYIAASVFGRVVDGQHERHERALFLRLHEEGLERHRDVGRRGLAGHDAVHELDDLLDFLLFLLAALLLVLLRRSLLRRGQRGRNHQRDRQGHCTPNCHHSSP